MDSDQGVIQEWQARVTALWALLKPWLPLCESHSVNALLQHPQPWHTLVPMPEWRVALAHANPVHANRLAAGLLQPRASDWPTGLCDLVARVQAMTASWPDSHEHQEEEEEAVSEPVELDTWFVNGMKPKKVHEVARMTPLVCALARQTNAEVVVDVGAGKGFLSQAVALHSGLPVVSVDSSEFHSGGRRERRAQQWQRAQCGSACNSDTSACDVCDRGQPRGMPRVVTRHVGPDMSEAEVAAMLSPCPGDGEEERRRGTGTMGSDKTSHGVRPSLLCGLHTCGDLAVTMLRMTQRIGSVTALVNVGCCYHRMAGPDGEACEATFPMSAYARTSVQARLGAGSLRLACVPVSQFATQEHGVGQIFQRHLFRCIMQVVLAQHVPSEYIASLGVGHIRKSKLKTMQGYARAALSKLVLCEAPEVVQSLDTEAVVAEAVSLYDKQGEEMLGVVQGMWALRNVFAPLVEHLILADRVLAMLEAGFHVRLVPLFDGHLSPRNHAIVAIRRQPQQ